MQSLCCWKILLFFTKKIDFITFLREISAAIFIWRVAAQEIFTFFIKKTVDLRRFCEKIWIHQNNVVQNHGYVLKLIAEKLQSSCGFV